MKIEHLAIWVNDLEKVKNFYSRYFDMTCGEKYENKQENFSSYFLAFDNTSTKLELMHKPEITEALSEKGATFGFTHIAFSVGSKQKVDKLTERLKADGYIVVGEPKATGDGFYESSILDVERNIVEITV